MILLIVVSMSQYNCEQICLQLPDNISTHSPEFMFAIPIDRYKGESGWFRFLGGGTTGECENGVR